MKQAKVTTYSVLLPNVGIVKILLSCFSIPIATIFIATFIRNVVEFHFFQIAGTFWYWSNILERRLKSQIYSWKKINQIRIWVKKILLQNCFHPILDIDTYLVNNRFPNRAYYAGKTFRFIPCCWNIVMCMIKAWSFYENIVYYILTLVIKLSTVLL